MAEVLDQVVLELKRDGADELEREFVPAAELGNRVAELKNSPDVYRIDVDYVSYVRVLRRNGDGDWVAKSYSADDEGDFAYSIDDPGYFSR